MNNIPENQENTQEHNSNLRDFEKPHDDNIKKISDAVKEGTGNVSPAMGHSPTIDISSNSPSGNQSNLQNRNTSPQGPNQPKNQTTWWDKLWDKLKIPVAIGVVIGALAGLVIAINAFIEAVKNRKKHNP